MARNLLVFRGMSHSVGIGVDIGDAGVDIGVDIGVDVGVLGCWRGWRAWLGVGDSGGFRPPASQPLSQPGGEGTSRAVKILLRFC